MPDFRALVTGEKGFLNLLRIIFIFFSGLIGWWFAITFSGSSYIIYSGILIGLFFGFLFVWFEVQFSRELLGIVSLLVIGLISGFLVTFLFYKTLFLLPIFDVFKQEPDRWDKYKFLIEVSLTFVFCYLSMAILIQCRDDFKFILPFVELRKEKQAISQRALLLDTSAIIDGRIMDILETNIVDAPVIVPRFVLEELQTLADSADKLKRNRGRRGLDILNKIQNSAKFKIEIHEANIPLTQGVDRKLMKLARSMSARIATTDFNLQKVAELEDISVLNINFLASALRPVFLPGEFLDLKLIRPGENAGQAVGFLEDGTMVVVESGYPHIGQVMPIVISSVITTSAGRILFAMLNHSAVSSRNRSTPRTR